MCESLKPTSPNQALERVIQTEHQFMLDITIKTLDEMERYAGPFQKGQDFFFAGKSLGLEDWDERHQDATPLGALPGARPCRR